MNEAHNFLFRLYRDFGCAFQDAGNVFDSDSRPLWNHQGSVLDLQLRLKPVGIFFDTFLVFLIRTDVRHNRGEMEAVNKTKSTREVDGRGHLGERRHTRHP